MELIRFDLYFNRIILAATENKLKEDKTKGK